MTNELRDEKVRTGFFPSTLPERSVYLSRDSVTASFFFPWSLHSTMNSWFPHRRDTPLSPWPLYMSMLLGVYFTCFYHMICLTPLPATFQPRAWSSPGRRRTTTTSYKVSQTET